MENVFCAVNVNIKGWVEKCCNCIWNKKAVAAVLI